MEIQFFAWIQLEKKRHVRTSDLVKAMNLSTKQSADLLYNLSSSGFIVKLQRGFYLVPQKIPSGGCWSPSPYLIINKYMENAGTKKFYVSGPAIFNLYGYSDQVSSWFTVYNNKFSKKLYILQYHLDFVKVVSSRLGIVRKIKSYDDMGGVIWTACGSPEQTLLDAVYDYKKYGTLPKAYDWISNALKDKKINPTKMATATVKYGNTISQKRIGWVLDKLVSEKKIVKPLWEKVSRSNFLTALDPKNRRGIVNKKWAVIENVKFS